MVASSTSLAAVSVFFFLLLHFGGGWAWAKRGGGSDSGSNDGSSLKQFADVDYLAFAMNLEYLETDFFLCAAFGYDLSAVEPGLTEGGPKPIGCKKAVFYHPWIKDIIKQFAFQEIGHLKAIKKMTQGFGFARPQMDISARLFANIIDTALSKQLIPPFDPYANDLNFLIASYVIPYVGLTAYVGAAPNLQDPAYKELVAGLLGVESGQDAVIRAILFQFKDYPIHASGITIAQVTDAISTLRNTLGNNGTKDEGLVVNPTQGAEGKISGNVLAGDEYSLAYARDPREVLNIVYSKTDANFGGFFPMGAQGNIADASN